MNCFLTLILAASLTGSSPLPQDSNLQLMTIDREILQLTPQIKHERLEAFNAEMEAQRLLFVEWDAYSQKIKEADKHTEAAQVLEKKMDDLQARKKALMEAQKR